MGKRTHAEIVEKEDGWIVKTKSRDAKWVADWLEIGDKVNVILPTLEQARFYQELVNDYTSYYFYTKRKGRESMFTMFRTRSEMPGSRNLQIVNLSALKAVFDKFLQKQE